MNHQHLFHVQRILDERPGGSGEPPQQVSNQRTRQPAVKQERADVRCTAVKQERADVRQTAGQHERADVRHAAGQQERAVRKQDDRDVEVAPDAEQISQVVAGLGGSRQSALFGFHCNFSGKL